MKIRRPALVLTAAAVAAITVGASPALAGTDGTGSVVTTVVSTVTPGALVISGAGVSVPSFGQVPGEFGATFGATAMSVSDLTASGNGWSVVATYSDPLAGTALGGSNVKVSGGNVVPDALGGVAASNVATQTDQPLSTPVTVATTGTNSGAGVTALQASLKVRIPATAAAATVYGARVTYTVSSVR